MCLYPRLIPNPKYRTSKKRGYYKPSPHDARLNYVPVACGKCYECRKKKAREWRIRLAEEIRHNKSYFVTLTIDDDNLEMLKNELGVKTVKGNENNIATLALRKFLERCRKKTGEIIKTLVCNRIRRRQRKNTSTWNIFREQCGRIGDRKVEIRICIYWELRKRENN